VDLREELEQMDQEIADTETQLIRLKVHLAGLQGQRASLAAELAAIADREISHRRPERRKYPNLEALDRTDAIVEVLRSAGVPMSIQEVWDALSAAGRRESKYQVIASTLNFLHREGRITRPSRGRYAA
jgi:chromosome segregation ATPase